MALKGTLLFKCHCGNEVKVNSNDFDFVNTWSDEDRGMGTEFGFDSEIDPTCTLCGKSHTIKFEYTEYPVGAINYENLIIDKDVEVLESTLTMF
ncbi:hypothetical protein [Erysipelothrix rhusiopathiae]|uniref:hypothetical protein n=1 Tax=Erysipelothrix rhusiopathiae TaxID=1648 RepID=UPI0039ED73FA